MVCLYHRCAGFYWCLPICRSYGKVAALYETQCGDKYRDSCSGYRGIAGQVSKKPAQMGSEGSERILTLSKYAPFPRLMRFARSINLAQV